jgi:hypothetical protein
MEALSGFTCAAAAVSLTYPIETLSRQFHVTNSATATTKTLWRDMSRSPKTFYRGLASALVTQPTYWAIYMPTYNALKTLSFSSLPNTSSFVAGWFAGVTATLVTNPLWVVRQRMQTEIVRKRVTTLPKNNEGYGYGYAALVLKLYKEDGLRTFFRGAGITLVKNVQMALLLPLFEQFNARADAVGLPKNAATVAVLAATAKIASSTLVYPLDVIRTNVRFREGARVNILDVTRELVSRPGGLRNLFRGIGWYWISAGSTFAAMMTAQHLISAR